jgi:hypothetical protein
VKEHLARARGKLGASSRFAAVAAAVGGGIIEPVVTAQPEPR